jgi:DNA-binding NtrC family response regulator
VEGAFERAHQGTLLLDEVSEMRLDMQAKLLRVLQEQEFERVGGSSPIKVDVRIIATTNRNLAAYAAQGHFRQDLFFRLSVLPISLPPLRDRPGDIPLLAHRFALRTASEMQKEIRGLAPETVEMLQRYDWPGNVRELQLAVERAVILSTDPILHPAAFDRERFGLTARGTGPASGRVASPARLQEMESLTGKLPPHSLLLTSLDVGEAEARLIGRALEVSGGNRTRAAELLGISVRTLRNKLNGPARDSAAG